MNTNDKLRELIRSPLSDGNPSADGVTQADRDAAAALIEEYWSGADDSMMKLARSYREGHSQGTFVRAFARHRQASIAQHEGGWGEPVAWMYEIATAFRNEEYCGWEPRLTKGKPFVPQGSMRNLTPLYAHPPATRPDALAEDRNAVLEEAEALDALCRTFEQWLKIGPSNQPTMPGSSIRPFSTGDLKAFVRGLRSLRSTEAPAQGGE